MKWLLKMLAFLVASLSVMQIVQDILEAFLHVPYAYAERIVTVAGIVATVTVMNILTRKGWL